VDLGHLNPKKVL